DAVMKKTQCPFLINTSCPKIKNPNSKVQINKINNEYNYRLNVEMIVFEEKQKFPSEMIEDINNSSKEIFRREYPSQPIYFNDLYAAIQKFRPTSEILLDNAASMSN
ncbi:45648_t:CDS:2, partial [Gigaspora margarita]